MVDPIITGPDGKCRAHVRLLVKWDKEGYHILPICQQSFDFFVFLCYSYINSYLQNHMPKGVRSETAVYAESSSLEKEKMEQHAKELSKKTKELAPLYADLCEAATKDAGYTEDEAKQVKKIFNDPAVKKEILLRFAETNDPSIKMEDVVNAAFDKKDHIKTLLEQRQKDLASLKGKRVYWNSQLSKLTKAGQLIPEKSKAIKDRIKQLEKQERKLSTSNLQIPGEIFLEEIPESSMVQDKWTPKYEDSETPADDAAVDRMFKDINRLPSKTAEQLENEEEFDFLGKSNKPDVRREIEAATPGFKKPSKETQPEQPHGKMDIGETDESQRMVEMPVITDEVLKKYNKEKGIGFGDWLSGGENPINPSADAELPTQIGMDKIKRDAGIIDQGREETPETDAEEEARVEFTDWMTHNGTSKKLMEKYPTKEAMKGFLDHPSLWSRINGDYDSALKAYTDFISLESAGAAKIDKRSAMGKERGTKTPSIMARENEGIGEMNEILQKHTTHIADFNLRQNEKGEFVVEMVTDDKTRSEVIKAKNLKDAQKEFDRRIEKVQKGLAKYKKDSMPDFGDWAADSDAKLRHELEVQQAMSAQGESDEQEAESQQKVEEFFEKTPDTNIGRTEWVNAFNDTSVWDLMAATSVMKDALRSVGLNSLADKKYSFSDYVDITEHPSFMEKLTGKPEKIKKALQLFHEKYQALKGPATATGLAGEILGRRKAAREAEEKQRLGGLA